MQVALRRRAVGMGEYPGYYCYDANRPSWLPYWLDTLREESCKVTAIPGDIAACLNPLSAECSTPANPNPAISGPGVGGPPLSAGNSTASVDPIENQTIPEAIGQATGVIVGGVTSGVVTGVSAGLGAYTAPLVIGGLIVLLIALKR